MASSCTGQLHIGSQEWFLHGRSGQALEGAAQGAGGVAIPSSCYLEGFTRQVDVVPRDAA